MSVDTWDAIKWLHSSQLLLSLQFWCFFWNEHSRNQAFYAVILDCSLMLDWYLEGLWWGGIGWAGAGGWGALNIFFPLPLFHFFHFTPNLSANFSLPSSPQLPNPRWQPNMKMYICLALKICLHCKLVVVCLDFTLTCLMQSLIKHLDTGLYPWLTWWYKRHCLTESAYGNPHCVWGSVSIKFVKLGFWLKLSVSN